MAFRHARNRKHRVRLSPGAAASSCSRRSMFECRFRNNSVRPLAAFCYLLCALHSLLSQVAPQKARDEHARDQSMLF